MAIRKKRKGLQNNRNDLIFYCIIMAWPVLQFAVFYIGVNFNSILIAFQDIDIVTNSYSWTAKHFVNGFEKMLSPTQLTMAKILFWHILLRYVQVFRLVCFFRIIFTKRCPAREYSALFYSCLPSFLVLLWFRCSVSSQRTHFLR